MVLPKVELPSERLAALMDSPIENLTVKQSLLVCGSNTSWAWIVHVSVGDQSFAFATRSLKPESLTQEGLTVRKIQESGLLDSISVVKGRGKGGRFWSWWPFRRG